MASFNRTIIVGTLTRDIELRYLQSGTAVGEVGIAVNERYKKGEEWVEEVSFFDCVFWARKAEVLAEYCGKGSSILIEGRLKQERWEKDGQKHSKVKIVADDFKMLDKKPQDGEQKPAPKQNQQRQQEEESRPF
jgi:single-strand DNA-binding protein